MKKYSLLTPGNGHQMGNKKKAMTILAALFEAKQTSYESLDVPNWGDCQVAAYTSTDGAMIVNASDPKKFGELPWHHRAHLIMLREIPDPKTPRCAIYICVIKDLFDAPAAEWLGKAGVKWTHVAKVAKLKQIHSAPDLAAPLGSP